MGETVDGKSPEVSTIVSKDPLVNLKHFDTNFMAAVDCGYMVVTKKRSEMDFTGVKSAWVDEKSNKSNKL